MLEKLDYENSHIERVMQIITFNLIKYNSLFNGLICVK